MWDGMFKGLPGLLVSSCIFLRNSVRFSSVRLLHSSTLHLHDQKHFCKDNQHVLYPMLFYGFPVQKEKNDSQ